MKSLFFLIALLAITALEAETSIEPIVWNGKFYPNKQLAQNLGYVSSSKPNPELAKEISKAEKYFIGTDALIWQKRKLLKRFNDIQSQRLVASHTNNEAALLRYIEMERLLHIQLTWLDQQILKSRAIVSETAKVPGRINRDPAIERQDRF